MRVGQRSGYNSMMVPTQGWLEQMGWQWSPSILKHGCGPVDSILDLFVSFDALNYYAARYDHS